MTRLIAILAAAVLIGFPLSLIYAITVPVTKFRSGSYADFLVFACTVVAIYDGVLLGVLWRVVRSGMAWGLILIFAVMLGALAQPPQFPCC